MDTPCGREGSEGKVDGAFGPEGCVEGLCSLRSGGDSAYGAEGCGLPSRAMSFISRLRRSRQHRVSILSAYLVHPFPLRGTSPQGEMRDMRKKQRVIYFRYHFGVFPLWCLTAPPSPPQFGGAAKGKRLNGQARRLTSPHLEVLCRTSTVAL